MNTIKILSVEGNIGSGKSTLLANFKKAFKNDKNVIFLQEPVDEWDKIKDENGITILEKFYSDQNKYSFSFQIMAYISRLKLLKNCIKEINSSEFIKTDKSPQTYFIITERSLYTDKMVFAKMLYDTGKIELVNYQIYLNWFHMFADDYPIDKVIYVKTDPEICHERIEKRNRNGEHNIPIEYLKSCSEYHDNMLSKSNICCVCQDQLILNGNHDIYENENILKDWLKSLENFIYS